MGIDLTNVNMEKVIISILFIIIGLVMLFLSLSVHGMRVESEELDIACQDIGYDEYAYSDGLRYCINNEEMQLVNTKCHKSSQYPYHVDSCEAYKIEAKGFSIE